MQVQPAIGLNFASGIRTLLRQDPDIIMVGVIRDLETAEMAVQAALTGHLVLSTLHTNDAASAITRLLDLGVPAYLIKSTLLGCSPSGWCAPSAPIASSREPLQTKPGASSRAPGRPPGLCACSAPMVAWHAA
ncbi:GspE/PulE family protein [Thiobacter aerophilum]|uniref:ATPase, T2SS/T4P/T4SS family n=1 Tax=Thiobacter aerophilum TaxID=3121275 RepID=A0ABV0ECR3_9BURK